MLVPYLGGYPFKIDVSRLFVTIFYFVGTFLLPVYIDSKIWAIFKRYLFVIYVFSIIHKNTILQYCKEEKKRSTKVHQEKTDITDIKMIHKDRYI